MPPPLTSSGSQGAALVRGWARAATGCEDVRLGDKRAQCTEPAGPVGAKAETGAGGAG